MGETSNIEWCSASWNPWMGCTKVSPGCARCYMFREQRQYGNDPELVRRSKTKFNDPLKWPDGRLIFTCSWSDWFHEAADEWRPEAWEIVRQTPHHTYQILTKRPERIADQLPADWGDGYPNVWLGVSIESQRYDYRAALLCQFPAAIRFVSAEPLLSPLDLTRVNPFTRMPDRTRAHAHTLEFIGLNVLEMPKRPPLCFTPGQRMGLIHWVIAGGESGPGHRVMDKRWVQSLRDQCRRHGVAFFLKQLGGWPDKRGAEQAVLDGVRWTEMPGGVPV